MTTEFQILLMTAASVGFLHTILGPDHYLPFIMIGKAREWTLKKTLWLTFCVGGTCVEFGGDWTGRDCYWGTVAKTDMAGRFQGQFGGLGLIAFGLAYAVWGLKHIFRPARERIKDEGATQSKKITPWVLFIIFVLGPCEVLIPVLMYPAANESVGALLTVTGVFGVTTLATMMGAVFLASYGLSFVSLKPIEKYTHTIAGLVIFLSGMAIQVLGL
ncbi:hypothetical protein [Geofilum rubicundum]|nr:hypothetical protein [Geofilum rubicundum]